MGWRDEEEARWGSEGEETDAAERGGLEQVSRAAVDERAVWIRQAAGRGGTFGPRGEAQTDGPRSR